MKKFSSFHSSILFITTQRSQEFYLNVPFPHVWGCLLRQTWTQCIYESMYLCIYVMHDQELAGIFSPDLHININRSFSQETSVCKSEKIQIISSSKYHDSDVFVYV